MQSRIEKQNILISDIQKCLGLIRPLSIEFHHDNEGKFKGAVFVHLANSDDAKSLVEKGCELEGKHIKVDLMRQARVSQSLEGSPDKIDHLIQAFLKSSDEECYLPTSLNADERKMAHSIAERLSLTHTTVSPPGVEDSDKVSRSVLLTKKRFSSQRSSFSMKSLNPDAPVFVPVAPIEKSAELITNLPNWLEERKTRKSRNSFSIGNTVEQI